MISGERVKLVKWIEGVASGRPFAVRVEVDAVIPDEDPSEPCLEPTTLSLLDKLRGLAERGDVDELARYGQLYLKRSA